MATRKLTVTALEPINRGKNAHGREWVLYRVSATGGDGRPVGQKLTTFGNLPLGQEREYEVTPYKDGESYTLRLAGKGPGWRQVTEDLAKRIDELARRVEELARR